MLIPTNTDATIAKGAEWLRTKQNRDGSYGTWGIGSTSLAILALLTSHVPVANPAIAAAVDYILANHEDSVYARSLSVMALTACNLLMDDASRKIQDDVEWLIEAQGSNQRTILSYGAWGPLDSRRPANMLHTQCALLALSSASPYINIPPNVWSKALIWFERNSSINRDGSYVYDLNDDCRFDSINATQLATAASLSSLKLLKKFVPDHKARLRAKALLLKARNWLQTNYIIKTANSLEKDLYYYYLFCLSIGCLIKPCDPLLGHYDWYKDAAESMIALQQPSGEWLGNLARRQQDVIYTSLAILTLAKCSPLTLVTPFFEPYRRDKKKKKNGGQQAQIKTYSRY